LCGDGLDVCVSSGRATILTGSWRPETPLELWDLGTGKALEALDWKESLLTAQQPCLVYAAQFSKLPGSRYVAAGGSGANEARVFDREAGTMSTHGGVGSGTALVGTVAGMARGVFSVDWSPVADRVAIGTGDGSVRILEVVERRSGDKDDAAAVGPTLEEVAAPEEEAVEAEPERDAWDDEKDGQSDDE
jgi:WD40 repeat protein